MCLSVCAEGVRKPATPSSQNSHEGGFHQHARQAPVAWRPEVLRWRGVLKRRDLAGGECAAQYPRAREAGSLE